VPQIFYFRANGFNATPLWLNKFTAPGHQASTDRLRGGAGDVAHTGSEAHCASIDDTTNLGGEAWTNSQRFVA
jgi:hypothetical protein